MAGPPSEALRTILEESRARGFLGEADIDAQIAHAEGFAEALGDVEPEVALDLGAGGGLPGLVLASRWGATRWILLDASERRTRFLIQAVSRLGLARRVTVERGRAEDLARGPDRGTVEVVTARGFGSPAVTLECGGGFLRPGGALVVSEPPDRVDRWPTDAVAALGFEVEPRTDGPYRVLRLTGTFPADRPRRVGIPTKRPLF